MTTSTEPATAELARRGRVPDFFIVGHPKSGTTALYEMLKAHPQIYMPDLKETRFFAPELHPRSERVTTHPTSLTDYLSLFQAATPEQRAGEASPSYLRSSGAASRIAELQPNARIIAILREPVSFLRSLHLELVRDHVETETDFAQAIALEQVRRHESEIRCAPGLVYADYIRYVEQLRRYHQAFPDGQVLVLIYDDFRRDNEQTVRTVLRFLGVDDTFPIQLSDANPTVRVRSLRMYDLVRSLYMGRGPAAGAVKTAIKKLTSRQLRRGALGIFRRRVLYAEPLPPDPELTLQLRRRFKGEVEALSEYLDRDLVTLWGYDRIS